MSQNTKSRADILSERRAPTYRVILLAGCGTVQGIMPLSADDDEQAKDRAKTMVDGHAVELWDGLRFIDHFTPPREDRTHVSGTSFSRTPLSGPPASGPK